MALPGLIQARWACLVLPPRRRMSELDAGEKALARLYMAGCFHQWGALPGEPAEPPGQSSLRKHTCCQALQRLC